MKRMHLSTIGLALLLTACNQTVKDVSVDSLLENPLFAERYSEGMVDMLTELFIQEDPALEDAAIENFVTKTKDEWLEMAREARGIQREGISGEFIPTAQYARGEVLYYDDTVYFGSLFEADPGPDVHVFITTIIDPRDVEFPDSTAVDLGAMKTPYGAQQYAVPAVDSPHQYRTVALWDTKLERLYGFAQIAQ